MNGNKYILISGCTGVGKSTLAELLHKELAYKLLTDPFEENPYIEDAYMDFKAWAFHSQLFFLSQFAKLHKRLDRETDNILQERSIYECFHIFLKQFYLEGNVSTRDYRLFEDLYKTLAGNVQRKPDLILYLNAPSEIILSRVRQRGRGFENTITKEFIDKQDLRYQEWLPTVGRDIRILKIDTAELNYLNNPVDLEYIMNEISCERT